MQAIVVYNLDIIDEQPRTVVTFKFKGPLPGFRDVDKPFKSGSVVTFQPAVGERIIGAREVEIRNRGQSRKRGAFEPTFSGETLELGAEPSREQSGSCALKWSA